MEEGGQCADCRRHGCVEEGFSTQHDWAFDEERIARDEEADGYYCIVTSEQEWSEREVIEAYRGLSRIEESFRVLKGDLGVFVQ